MGCAIWSAMSAISINLQHKRDSRESISRFVRIIVRVCSKKPHFPQATNRGSHTEFHNMGWSIHCWCGIRTSNDHVDLATLSNDPNHYDDRNVLLSDLECAISGRHHLQHEQSLSTCHERHRTEIVYVSIYS